MAQISGEHWNYSCTNNFCNRRIIVSSLTGELNRLHVVRVCMRSSKLDSVISDIMMELHRSDAMDKKKKNRHKSYVYFFASCWDRTMIVRTNKHNKSTWRWTFSIFFDDLVLVTYDTLSVQQSCSILWTYVETYLEPDSSGASSAHLRRAYFNIKNSWH